MKQRKLILILAIVLSVAVAAGGTMAYLQDTDEDVNVMTLGNVYITQNEQERNEAGELVPFTQEKPMYPAVYEGSGIDYADQEDWPVPGDKAWQMLKDNENVIDKIVTVTNTGKSPAYVRTLIAFEGTDVYGPNGNNNYIKYLWNDSTVGDRIAPALEGEITVDGVDYTVISFTYVNELAPGETTIPSLKQLYLSKDAGNEEMEYYGEYYDVLVLSQAVQTQGFVDGEDENESAANEALDTAFGKADVTENLIKWFSVVGKNVGSPGDKNETNNPPVIVPENAEKAETVDAVMEALENGGVVEYTGEEDLVIDGFTAVKADTELYLNGAKIIIEDGATLLIEKNELSIFDAVITAEEGDGQIKVGGGAILTLGAGTEINGVSEVSASGLINVYGESSGNAKIVLDGTVVTDNGNAGVGPLFNISDGAEMVIEEGTEIRNNVISLTGISSQPQRSVINVNGNGLLTMNGGVIADNEFAHRALITLQGGKFVMNDGVITNNTYNGTANSHAIVMGLRIGSAFEMNGGKIEAADAVAFDFGNVSGNGIIAINGGEVSCDSRFANVNQYEALVVGDDAVVNGSVYHSWAGTQKDVSEF